jgi:hypothetical protein
MFLKSCGHKEVSANTGYQQKGTDTFIIWAVFNKKRDSG